MALKPLGVASATKNTVPPSTRRTPYHSGRDTGGGCSADRGLVPTSVMTDVRRVGNGWGESSSQSLTTPWRRGEPPTGVDPSHPVAVALSEYSRLVRERESAAR